MVTVVWGLTECESFGSLGETSNELVFLSGCLVVVLNHDVLLGRITQSQSTKTEVMFGRTAEMSDHQQLENEDGVET